MRCRQHAPPPYVVRKPVAPVFAALCAVAASAAAAPAQTFAAAGISMSFTPSGKVASLIDTVAGCERVGVLLEANRPYACRVTYNGTAYDPTSFVQTDSLLIFTFGTIPTAPSVTVSVTTRPTYLVFTLASITNTAGIEEVEFLNFNTVNPQVSSLYRFVTYSDCGMARRLGVYPLDRFTMTSTGGQGSGGYVRAEAFPNLPWTSEVTMVGRKAALFTCADSQEAVLAACATIEADYNIPLGASIKQEEVLGSSQFFWMDFDYADRAQAIAYTQAAGFKKVLLRAGFWADRYNSYEVRTDKWGGAANLAAWIDDCHAAGLTVGAHLTHSKIPKEHIPYIRDGASPILRRLKTATLAAAVPIDQVTGIIQTTEPPVGWPTEFEKKYIVIDQEIIAYKTLRTTMPPYGFEGPFWRAANQEGGLGRQAHSAGATVGLLSVTEDLWGYELDLAGGVQQYSADIATKLDAAGFDYIYLDGLEYRDCPDWYSLNAQKYAIYDAMTNKPAWVESSGNAGSHSWPLLGMDGQIDYTYIEANGLKSEVNRDLERKFSSGQRALTEYTQLQLGWAELSNPSTRHTSVDEIEYMLAKSIAYDMPVTIQVWMSSLETWPNRDANLWLLNQYEQLRLSGYFTQAEKNAAKAVDKDFMLFRRPSGVWSLERVSLLNISRDVRGYITRSALDGVRYATIWPLEDEVLAVTLVAPAVGSFTVADYAGNPVPVVNLGGGLYKFMLGTRVYVRMVNLSDAESVFDHAVITTPEEAGM
ncbi:MAG: hypothetical protein HRF50_09265 [Phycisphaerae bacterium]